MKDIPGYEGRYSATKEGRIYSHKNKRLLKNYRTKNGYLKVELHKDGGSKAMLVHRLIALTYIPNPSNYPHINHLDSVRDNNLWTNLEWCTPSMNSMHAISKGSHVTAKVRKLTPETMTQIIQMRRKGMSQPKIAKVLGVSTPTVGDYLLGKTYRTFK